MKIALLSDPHITWYKPKARLDDARKTSFGKFRNVVEWCQKHGVPLFIAGDLTEEPRSWLAATRLALMLMRHRVDVYAVFGQHDTYMYSESTRDATVLGVLMNAGLIKQLSDEPEFIGEPESVFAAYGYSYSAKEQEIAPARLVENVLNLLVIHAPIAENALWRGQKNYISAKKFFLENDTYDVILCGDIHRRFCLSTLGKRFNNRYICNTGPLFRSEASLYMFSHEPGFWIFDSEEGRMDWMPVPHQPADDVLTRKHLYEEGPLQSRQEFIKSVRTELSQADPEELEDVRDDIIAFLRRAKAPDRLIDLMAEVIMEE